VVRSKSVSQVVACGGLALALVVSTAIPGSAYGFKDGYRYRSSCIQPSDPWVRAQGSGTLNIVGPGQPYETERSGSPGYWYVAGTYNGGYWSVEAPGSGTVSSSGTYSFCLNP
jgi:hypothetical protein